MPTNTTRLSQQCSKTLLLPALWQDGRVFIDAEDLHGYAEELEEDTIIFYAAYKDGSHRAGADVWDLIRLTSAETRFRTWQIQAGGNVVRLCEVAETKSSWRIEGTEPTCEEDTVLEQCLDSTSAQDHTGSSACN